jgi:hypothetical protein
MCLGYDKCFRIGNWEIDNDLIYVYMMWYVGKYRKDVVTFDVKNINGTKKEIKRFK